VELLPWKKGWHRPVAPQYARPDFMRCRSPPGTGLWPHNMWGPTLCGAAPSFRLHCSRYQVWGGAAPHIPMPCIFQCHGPVPPPFPWRHILCVFSRLNCPHHRVCFRTEKIEGGVRITNQPIGSLYYICLICHGLFFRIFFVFLIRKGVGRAWSLLSHVFCSKEDPGAVQL